ncbi:hypothetical protein AB4Z19_18355 [Pseudoduganella sp. RAF19]|uniref:hypothetical protein n=1 Tax=Pseudoduganella sp. RAF19 TaxID=3233052 RepID=UPI003F9C4A7F
MSEYLNQNLATVQSLLCLVLLIAIYFSFKFRIDLWWLNFWYALPFVGKTARLANDSSRFAKDNSWTNSERTLCNDYAQFMHLTSEAEFNKRIDYMSKAGDTGRSPTPGWLFLVLGLLIIAEGMGFSYLLGSWMAMEGSENTRLLLMGGIVFVLCVVMGFLTHNAGHQLFRTNLIRRCKKEWIDDGKKGKLRTVNISLKDDQRQDDSLPHYTQCVNRVGNDSSYALVGIAAAAIIVIAVMSTVMRVKHLESDQGRETLQSVPTAQASAEGNPFANGALPAEITAPQAAADTKAKEDINSSTKVEGLSAFVMLAFIFVVTQIVGIIAGYKWGFAGKNSKDAYKSTLGFSTYDDYSRYFSPILSNAEAKLSTLQQRLIEQGDNVDLSLKHTFEQFLTERHATHLEQAGVRQRQSAAAATTQPTAEQVLERVEQFGDDKESAKGYLMGLDAELRAQVTPLLKARKERRQRTEDAQRAAKQAQELDDIL